jgi:purine-nucleoside/S-methyl-5'-thioadenosine phosphorylase / adenosine deaminase
MSGKSAIPPGWLSPDWPAPANVRAVCTTREGGVSAAPYASLNLGDHVGDRAADVQANRAALRSAIGARPVFLQQVHGCDVLSLSPGTRDGSVADACETQAPGIACTIMVADCLPVLFTDRSGSWVAAAHAGWRGLAGEGGQGVLEAVLKSFQASARHESGQTAIKSEANELLAWLGPCIGPQAFEVGAEVREAFCATDGGAAAHFKPQGSAGKYLADLPGLARRRLQALGVMRVSGNDGSAAWCTVSDPARFFSHRRDTARLGGSGRFAACVWLEGAAERS